MNNTTGFLAESIKQVCIVYNPKVIIQDFDQWVAKSFACYNIQAQTYKETDNLNFCQTTLQLHYTALRSWDMAPYRVSAQFNLIQNGHQVSETSFRLKGNRGMALNKWRSTQTKINELVD